METEFDNELRQESMNIQHTILKTMVELIDIKENSVGEHSQRTGIYAQIIAKELVKKGYYLDEISEEFIAKLRYAAPLHDIGKLYTPDDILNKPGKLNDKEFETMKLHTIDGGRIIDGLMKKSNKEANFTDLLDFAKQIALYHHEKWNGVGYPYGLSELGIPLSARILAVADVFDALTSKRVYRDAMCVEDALKIIYAESGTHFDPIIVGAFLSSFDEIRKILESNNKKVK